MPQLFRLCHLLSLVSLSVYFVSQGCAAEPAGVVYQGKAGPGVGKHIVLVTGDEEYRSEEALPALAKVLAKHHGFKCTVLFAIDPATGTISPNTNNNIPGLEALDSADLLILFTRFRDLPDDQMAHFVKYIEAGKPIIGLRTATHAFKIDRPDAKYAKYSFQAKDWDGGFGRQVLGETWISHHGKHKVQSTRGLIVPGMESHPILKGVKSGDIWTPTDVYAVRLPLPADCQPLLFGEVLDGMSNEAAAAPGAQNDPKMPVAWTRNYIGMNGHSGRVFTTTMGSAQDLSNDALRRVLVNAAYWCLGMEDKIDPQSSVATVGEYKPHGFGAANPNRPPKAVQAEADLPYKSGSFQAGVKPSDLTDPELTPR